MTVTTRANPTSSARVHHVFRPQDFAWILFAAALITADPETNYNATIVLLLIGAFQVAEPRIKLLSSKR
ncbi:MAG: hypothetical protein JO211_15885, partial [Acidobacteriaceae bacterium]|nr:hypothetical protein [Acidobacteriaceae bacterium]